MNQEEWESLCDGCGLCCMVKLEDEGSGDIYNTTVSCRQLDIEICRCQDYENRLNNVPMCTKLTLDNIAQQHWLPETCAYRCLYENRPLPCWHPLITGNNFSVHEAGVDRKSVV